MAIDTRLIPHDRVWELAERLTEGIVQYREKSPHPVGKPEEVLTYLSQPDGDELFVILLDGAYGGFMTFKVQKLNDEVWGTIAMIFLTEEAQRADALPEAAKQLEEELRSRGATVMNYMTARKGFRRLAPSLGFKPRIVEWMKEL